MTSETMLLAHGEQVSWGTFGTDWLYLLVPVAALIAIVAWLAVTGTTTRRGVVPALVGRIGSSLERVTGIPAWAAAGIGMGAWALLVAVIGFLWDVAWHIDFGRDEFLFTPSHLMILVGLAAIVASAAATILFASVLEADTGWRRGRVRLPYGAVALGALGLGAIAGFPLDELWHRNYGIDVTMWGPTHLLMISGASFAPLGMWLLFREAQSGMRDERFARVIKLFLAAATVVGLSTFQAEFDFGVPQFQQLYHPVLIAAATGVGLVLARTVLGAGGALIAAASFLAVRGALVALLGPVLNQTVARPPLYVGAALTVELAAIFARRVQPLSRAIVTGLLVGTAGLASEWAWTHAFGRHPWGPNLFPGVLVAVAVAVAAAVLGTAMGRVLSSGAPGIATAPLVLAALALLAGLMLPLPRSDAAYEATMTTEPAGEGTVDLTIAVDPPTAVTETDMFEVMSWQGGSLVITELVGNASGSYRSATPVPADGDWKSMVRISDKDVMVAAPVFMPADPEIGAAEIPVAPLRSAPFERDTKLLMREAHAGAAWPVTIAYTSILGVALCWIAALTAGFVRLGSDRGRRRKAGAIGGTKKAVTT